MRWEEYRQKKADIFWAAQEAEERNAMIHEDPQRLHEADIRMQSVQYLMALDFVEHALQAFMQEALQLAERYERDCMERVEREQREAGMDAPETTLDKSLNSCTCQTSDTQCRTFQAVLMMVP